MKKKHQLLDEEDAYKSAPVVTSILGDCGIYLGTTFQYYIIKAQALFSYEKNGDFAS